MEMQIQMEDAARRSQDAGAGAGAGVAVGARDFLWSIRGFACHLADGRRRSVGHLINDKRQTTRRRQGHGRWNPGVAVERDDAVRSAALVLLRRQCDDI